MKAEKQLQNDQVEEEIDIDLNDPHVEKTATKIQASFKGNKARKEVQQMKAEKQLQNDQVEEEIDIDLNDPHVEKTATKIQASYKGNKARKEVNQMKAEKDLNSRLIEDEETGCTITEARRPSLEAIEQIDIDLDDLELHESATKIQAGFRGKKARDEVKQMQLEKKGQKLKDDDIKIDFDKEKIESDVKDVREVVEEPLVRDENENVQARKEPIDWNNPELNDIATNIQAGYRGMAVREASKKKEEDGAAIKLQSNFRGFHDRKKVKKMKKDKEVSEKLGINLKDPEVEAAATKIQAGFRGLKARKTLKKRNDPPEIVVEETSEYTEYESETSWYEDEDDDSLSLEERPLSPETSVSRFSDKSESQDSVKLSGFKALAAVAKLMKKRKDQFDERRRSSLKDVVSMSRMFAVKSVNKPENNTNDQEIVEDNKKEDQNDEQKKEKNDASDSDNEEYSSDDYSGSGEESEEGSDEDSVETTDKKPFFLLKRLVGIMSMTGGNLAGTMTIPLKSNKVGILEEVKENSDESVEQEKPKDFPAPADVNVDFAVVVTVVDDASI